jgi:peptide/nickel transport system substrate-binding protein
VIEEPSNVVSYLMLNVRSEPLNNPIVRQAIAAMIDRPLLTERIYKSKLLRSIA